MTRVPSLGFALTFVSACGFKIDVVCHYVSRGAGSF